MSHAPYGAPPAQPLERRYRRFSLQQPVCMRVHLANSAVEFKGVSRNVSVGGLLIESARMIPPHTPVSFVITVPAAVRPIQFTGEGKVVRVDAEARKARFAIAIECERPITQLQDYLAATGS